MSEITLRSRKIIAKKRRPTLRVVSDVPVVIPRKVNTQKDIIVSHKIFINSIFCELIEKI